ncbi:MAG: hypothetical protein KDA68_15660 [Planctomycetaceae bacterium]|nr:hypothetical protein [Planctomycetaceae bacterium]
MIRTKRESRHFGSSGTKGHRRTGKISKFSVYFISGLSLLLIGISLAFLASPIQVRNTTGVQSKEIDEPSESPDLNFPEDWPSISPVELFKGTRSVKCPGKLTEFVSGAGGRFVIAKIEHPPSLHIFDTNQFQFVKALSLESPDELICASRKILFAINPSSGRCMRWSLNGFEKLPVVDLEVPVPIESIGVGPDSEGPVLVSRHPKYEEREMANAKNWPSPFIFLYDPVTMNRLMYKPILFRGERGNPSNSGMISVSPDGTTYALSRGRTCLRVAGEMLVVRRVARGDGITHAGENGHLLIDNAGQSRYFNWKPTSRTVLADFLPKAEKRLYLGAYRLCVTSEGENLLFQAIDPETIIRASTTPELIFTSLPPSLAYTGETLNYKIGFASNQTEKSTFALIESPPGMSINDEGVVSWEVPREAEQKMFDVGVEVRQGSLLKREQWFSVFCHSRLAEHEIPKTSPPVKSATHRESRPERAQTKSSSPIIPSRFVRSPLSTVEGAWTSELSNSTLSQTEFKDGQSSIKFQTSFLDIAVGGEGRYFVLAAGDTPEVQMRDEKRHIPKPPRIRKLIVWDLINLKTHFEVPIHESSESDQRNPKEEDVDPELLFTAGRRELILYRRISNSFERWDLETGRQIRVIPNPHSVTVNAMAMGSASEGPVAMGFYDKNQRAIQNEDVMIVDSGDFTKLIEKFGAESFLTHQGVYGIDLRAAANGSCFSIYCRNIMGSSMQYFLLRRKIEWPLLASGHFGHRLPGPDGSTLFTSRGVFNADGQKGLPTPLNHYTNSFPACSGSWYVNLASADGSLITGNTEKLRVFPELKLRDDQEMSIPLKQFEFEWLPPRRPVTSSPWFPDDQRIHLIPWANLLLVIPIETNRIDLYQVDLDKLLKSSGKAHLYIRSRPPSHVKANRRFEYQIETTGSSAPFKYTLELGPPNASVNAQGLLSWETPKNGGVSPHSFIIKVSDREERIVRQSFECHVE